ncbi:MAG: type II toxin-antitoxin system VapC family toxin [Brevundimonas sp.]
MLAIDTNVVVRYLTGDDPVQAAQARTLVDKDQVFVGDTVVLECDWVLRSAYGYGARQVADALRRFAGLPTVMLESPERIARALDMVDQGVDFADALHLTRAEHCEGFITFDRGLVKAAGVLGATTVRTP